MLERLTATAGARPWRTLALVLAFVVIGGAFAGTLPDRLTADGGFAPESAESTRADLQLEQATGVDPNPAVVLLLRGPAGELEVEADAAAVRLAEVPGIAEARPIAVEAAGALVGGTAHASADDEDIAEGALAAFEDDSRVTVGGPAVADLQLSETISADLARAELFALPLLLILSLIFFRGRATLLPALTGIATVLGTFLVLLAVNQVYALNVFALNLVIGLGLGLAIDYTLFLVTRFREELAGGSEPARALRTTVRTAGRTVAFSAATVAAALATLTVFPLGFAQSMGIAGAAVAIVAAVAALVISPALFMLWGTKLLRGDQRGPAAADRRWHRFAHAVMRRPGLVAASTVAVMLAAALPATGAEWTPVDSTAIPTDKSSRTVADASRQEFEGAGSTPVTVAVTAPQDATAELATYADRIGGIDGVNAVTRPAYLGQETWLVTATVPGDPAGEVAQRVVGDVREVGSPPHAAVSGPAAAFLDQQEAIGSRLELAIALLCALTFAVLWLMTGSVILPLKAIVMNALTVGAALSPLVFIYQGGHLEGLLGYTSNGGVEPTDFLVTAAIVFALSTDYGVFLLGRIKEARDGGASESEAVAAGLARTGRVVTAAAILLAVAIGAFSTSSISFIQQIGIAAATGVLIDAFVVRTLLVPSLMVLLGRWNWWSPRPLRRLHGRVGVAEPASAPVAAPLGPGIRSDR